MVLAILDSGRSVQSPPLSAVLLSKVSVTHIQLWSENIKWKNLRNKPFISFKLITVLSSVMKSNPSCSVPSGT